MSMSTHIIGFRPPDEKWKQMKSVYDACTAAKIPVPDEVDDFFNGEEPDKSGVEVSEATLRSTKSLRPWRDSYREGYEIEVKNLPKDVTILRFYNSW